MERKRIASIVLSAAIGLTLLAGCNSGNQTSSAPAPAPSSQPEAQAPASESNQAPAAGGSIRTGLGVATKLNRSYNAGEGRGTDNGRVQVDSAVAVITVDENGVIIKCTIDAAQTRVDFTPDGLLATDKSTPIRTKYELGDEYNMRPASPIEREWHEQIVSFAEFAIGKTPEELLAINTKEVDESHLFVPDVPDLVSTVTITVEDYLEAVRRAAQNLRPATVEGDFKTGLGINTNINSSGNPGEARGTDNGRGQVDSYVAGVTVDSNGVIVACTLDSIQARLDFDSEGNLVGDKTEPNRTKLERGDDYNMRPASEISKEWDEQANAFAEWVIGKTLADLKSMSLKSVETRDNVPDEPDLVATVTLPVDTFIAAIEKAIGNAK